MKLTLVAMLALVAVVAAYDCPTKHGIYPDPDDCHKFYMCHDSNPDRDYDHIDCNPEGGNINEFNLEINFCLEQAPGTDCGGK